MVAKIERKKKDTNIFESDVERPIFMAQTTTSQKIGSAPKEENVTGTQTMDDRNIKVSISRDDNGAEWCYENDVAVSTSVDRLDNIINTGYDVYINNDSDETEENKQKAKKLIEERVTILPDKISTMIKNRAIFGWGILKKQKAKNGDIIGLIELNTKECKPIRNLQTGELGDGAGKGLDPNNKNKDVAVVQDGNVATYGYDGSVSYTQNYFYLERDDILYWTNSDRGKFSGISPVRKVIRLVEIKKTLENTVELIVRRFGPQIKATVGNSDINLANSDIPESYLRDSSSGDPVARGTARTNFKNDVFSNLETNIQEWASGDTLVQIMEYGVDIQTLNPSSNLMDYSRYINLFSNYIRLGILGLTPQGRIDVTSAVMQESVQRDIKDKANKDRLILENILNKEYIKVILKYNGFKEDCIFIKSKPVDKIDEQTDVAIERQKSDTIFNYARSGFTKLPEHLTKKWGVSFDEVTPISQVNQNIKDKAKEEKEKGIAGPMTKTKEEMAKGR